MGIGWGLRRDGLVLGPLADLLPGATIAADAVGRRLARDPDRGGIEGRVAGRFVLAAVVQIASAQEPTNTETLDQKNEFRGVVAPRPVIPREDLLNIGTLLI